MKPTAKLWRWLAEAAAPREAWSPSEWAEKAPRIIPDNGVNPEPGPMRFDRTPYLREIADTIEAPATEIVVVVKPTQVGYTTLLEMMPGYWADLDPGACMLVLPDEKTAKAVLTSRVLATIRATPCLERHLSERAHDTKQDVIWLDTMPIFAAWAGSPMSVASWSIRRILFDEVDKYPRFSSDEGDPIMLGLKRVSNWLHRSRAVIGSTPTTRDGNVWRWWEACGDRRHNWLPCPHCGEYQVLVWSQVKWPEVGKGEERAAAADRIQSRALAWYECEHCRGRIEDRHKPAMLTRGVWASEDQVVARDGTPRGPRPDSRRIGFHLNSMYSPWVSFSTLAAEYLLAIGDPARMMDFRNSRLAEPFEEQASRVRPEIFEAKVEKAAANQWRPGIAPRWAAVVTLTVDTQKDHFWAVLRAWGHKFRSRLLRFERLETFEDIEDLLRRPVEVEGGGTLPVRLCVIDSGGTADPETGLSRTNQVYQFSLKNPALIVPAKGASQQMHNNLRHTRVTPKMPDGMQQMPPIGLVLVNTAFYKDLLSARMNDKEVEWELTAEAEKYEYLRQITAEHKIFDRKANRYRWVPISMGAPNHALDCYDEATEVLTRNGWRRFAALGGDEELATVNLATDRIEYQRPTHLIAKPYSGDMVKIGGEFRSRQDLLVTPGHRMVIYKGQRSRGPVIAKAKDLTIWDKLKTRATWAGSGVTTVRIPACRHWPERILSAVDLAKFIGWYIAEGYCRINRHKDRPNARMWRVMIYQNHGAKRERLKAILDRLPWKYHETDRGCVICSRQVHDLLCDLGNKYTKRVPQWIKDASPDVIKAFIEEAVQGDGWNCGPHQAYATVSKQLADDMQELYLKAGYAVSMKIRPAKAYCIRGRSGDNTRDQYHVHRKTERFAHLRNGENKPKFRTVYYNGMVYCATVPNGTLVVRRNGNVVVCGNCEVLQCVAADLTNVQLVPDGYEHAEPQREQASEVSRDRERRSGWATSHRGRY